MLMIGQCLLRAIKDAMVAKVLGGCGAHNAMLYVRALPEDLEVGAGSCVHVAIHTDRW
jgi:choline dehydrogenase-like flavoprotein